MQRQTCPPLDFLRNGIAQIALVVPNLERAVENYWTYFGIGPWHFYTYGKPLVKRMTRNGQPAEYRMRVALSHIGSLRIELIEQIEGDTVYQEFIDQHGYGVHHIGILTDNMEKSTSEAQAAGFTVTQDGSGFGLDNDGHYAYLDTEEKVGITIELIERPNRRSAPEKVFPPDR